MNTIYEIWIFNEVRYQSWNTSNKIIAGKEYLLLDKCSRSEPEGVRHWATFHELDENGVPKTDKIFVGDYDWWFKQIDFKTATKVGEIEKVCKWKIKVKTGE
jgi:hypothetical protein